MEIHSSDILQSSEGIMIQLTDTLILFDEALSLDDCGLIIERFQRVPFTQCVEGELTEDLLPVPVNEGDGHRMKYKDDFGKEMYCFSHDLNKDFDYLVEKVKNFLPQNEDFEIIHFGQIIRYPPDASSPQKHEGYERGDTGIVVVELNNGYVGGRITVNGHLIYPKTGSLIAWNNPIDRFSGVEPILAGEKYEMRLWFGRDPDTTEQFEEQSKDEEIKPKFQDYILPKELNASTNQMS